jgi:hypothetical protein
LIRLQVASNGLTIVGRNVKLAYREWGTPEVGLLPQSGCDHSGLVSDLRERVPGHSLVDELLRQWDLGTIHVDPASDGIVIDDDAVSWYRGVIGERRVAALLAHLGSAWTVLHSVPVGSGSSDIDHIVIGPAGVFTINTKYSPGKKVWVGGYGLYVDGFPQQYVRNSVSEAARASDLLSRAVGMTVPVTGLIVFVDAGSVTRKAPAGGGTDTPTIEVVRDLELLAAFATRPIFSTEQVERIVDKAVPPMTWHRAPSTSTTGKHIALEFEALEAAVGPRLAQPVARPAVTRTPSQRRTSRTAASSRPPAGRPTRKRKPKQTPLEKFIGGLIAPAAGIAIMWGVVSYLTNR